VIIESLSSPDENNRANAASVLSALSDTHIKLIPIKQILPLWLSESSNKVKKELTKIFTLLAYSDPSVLKPLMPMIIKGLSDSNPSVRKSIAKMFAELAEKTPGLVPLSAVQTMFKDSESAVREASMNILCFIGQDIPKQSIELIKLGLNDAEWDVKNAAAEAIAKIGEHGENPEIIAEIRKLLHDNSRWVRLKAIEIISKVLEKQKDIVSLTEVLAIVKQKDIEETMLIASVKLLGVVAASNFDSAFPEMIGLLQHTNEKVREGMISGMAKLSGLIPLKDYVPKLLTYLSDETELIIQQSIALLLKKIVKYESEAIKSRVISLLKIRCQMSQDPIICEALSELQN
jgi:HEAT repeat protein